MSLFLYPLLVLHFWYFEAPFRLIKFFKSLNIYLLNILSLTTFIKTFFRPLKNEYRGDLVGFSIGMGIVVKSVLILVNVILLTFIIFLESLFLIFFLAFPVSLIYLSFFNNNLF